ncbi:Protein MIZU-KUSSEI 1-like, plant [Sesbania bispinosa]|nr:Protein MIZU-KUSSEI 1-like, plant [Sesbania bispinosa]
MESGVTTVDCHKQVRSWRLLRSFMELLIPTCNCATTIIEEDHEEVISDTCHKISSSKCGSSLITGTIFGYRRGKVSFCIQANANSTNPILLLELAVPTSILAKEMRGGTLRISLESSSGNNNNSSSLLSTPVWTMYCNGRKVGYAVKRRPSNMDYEALRLMRSVVVGTGVMKCKEEEEDDQVMYLRGNFQRVRGSSECESFHLIDPEGDIDQELSIFFFRSS